MDNDTKIIVLALSGGVLGWSLGGLIDYLLGRLEVKRPVWVYLAILVAMVALIFTIKT